MKSTPIFDKKQETESIHCWDDDNNTNN